MSKPFPLDLFPPQLFPDVALKSTHLSAKTLAVTVSDSEWGIQSDITFFYGPGTMTFAYTGAARIRQRGVREKDWKDAATPEILKRITDFEMVSRKEPGWSFRFRASDANLLVEIILPEVTGVTWSGDGADLEEED